MDTKRSLALFLALILIASVANIWINRTTPKQLIVNSTNKTDLHFDNVYYDGILTGYNPNVIVSTLPLKEGKRLPRRDNGSQTLTRRYITVSRGKGNGLGNGMFRYAAIYAIGNITGKIPVLGPWFDDIHSSFKITIPNNTTTKQFHNFKIIKQNETLYRNNFSNIAAIDDDVMLNGYFTSFRYFEKFKLEIRREFTFKDDVMEKVHKFFESVEYVHTRVGVHIRGTDHNTTAQLNSGTGTPPLSYFRNAMRVFRTLYAKVQFVVCSDDPEWAESHITGNDVVFSHSREAAVDMAILSSCNHVIVGQGTYAFWVGWLCNGTSVYYQKPNKPCSNGFYPKDELNTWFGISH
jgi:galactoside 2-L-fucosyltransferase 1/2